MQEFISFAGIIGALTIGTVSPGPSFVMVAKIAVSTSRADGVAASLGIGIGGVAFAVAALLGLQAVLLAVPNVYIGLKLLGGLYLCYLGYRIFLSAKQPLTVAGSGVGERKSLSGSFWLGLTTQVSNPKAAIVYASVFAAFLPDTFSVPFALILVAVVFAIEAGWYAIVAALLSSSRPRRVYLSYKAWLDRSAGLVMAGLGVKLITSVHE
jgi:threonine/homoserine/homoserine lactone efflux protein